MEALYSKLYNKYTTLKKEKESQFDKVNRDQEEKFLNYVTVADEMIQHLKSENDKLREQVDELKSELDSIRSSSNEQLQYQKLFEEENLKNKELTEEVARLQKLEHNDCSLCSVHEGVRSGQENSPEDTSEDGTPGKSDRRLMKKRKSMHGKEGEATSYAGLQLDGPADQRVYGDKGSDADPSIQQPACCQKKIYSSGGDAAESSSTDCVFQYLVEFVVGLKISPFTQSNELCVTAHHQSSGYSFSLTWITNSQGEAEMMYRVLSLGTFERVAPEWMKEPLLFSTSMCKIFFERVSRVIKS